MASTLWSLRSTCIVAAQGALGRVRQWPDEAGLDGGFAGAAGEAGWHESC
jgi:hypothetical protein